MLDDIDMSLRDGEILGLLGRSGSGKSTLLRIAGGLIRPTSGEVLYRGAPLTGPAEGIAVVFQTFALFPWLTVLENVEAGLDALGLPPRRGAPTRAGRPSISSVSTASSPPIRASFRAACANASALPGRSSTRPDVLLMDEPFSALDVLTAETLRTDFLDLWIGTPAADQIGADGDAQHRGSGADVRPPGHSVVESGAASPRRSRSRCRIRATGSTRNSATSSTRSIRC